MKQYDRDLITIPPDGCPESEQPQWRRDFPIDWPQDNYVARRDFTKFMILTSLAFAVGQVWIGIQNWLRKRRGDLPISKIVSLDQIPVRAVVGFAYPAENDKCVLIRTDEKTFIAFSQKCTHLSCAVVPRPDQNRIDCPCHEGCFDLSTGNPIAGPPRRPLPVIRLEIRQGTVYATGIETRSV